jgi:hypothetical protein
VVRTGLGASCWPSSRSLVPHPLADDLPGLLTARGMTTPAIRVLLQVFIGQGIFKGAAMEIQGHDIARRERVLRQLRQEEFTDNACAGHSHPTLTSRCWMRGDHDPAGFWAIGPRDRSGQS